MTAASLRPGPDLFSDICGRHAAGPRRDALAVSLLGQAGILVLVIYVTSRVIATPEIVRRFPHPGELPIIFSGSNGGGGGDRDPLPASYGTPPRASLEMQIVSPTVMLPT